MARQSDLTQEIVAVGTGRFRHRGATTGSGDGQPCLREGPRRLPRPGGSTPRGGAEEATAGGDEPPQAGLTWDQIGERLHARDSARELVLPQPGAG